VTQLARATLREPLSLARITASEYARFGVVNSVRAFHRLTEYPTLERLSELPIPFLAVLGARDPLVSRPRMTEILQSTGRMDQVFEVNAAHAINFSHPETLSRIVDAYLRDQPLPAPTDDDRSIYGENEHQSQGV
jgi:hypothetical protein